jgi:hypothetical protein
MEIRPSITFVETKCVMDEATQAVAPTAVEVIARNSIVLKQIGVA